MADHRAVGRDHMLQRRALSLQLKGARAVAIHHQREKLSGDDAIHFVATNQARYLFGKLLDVIQRRFPSPQFFCREQIQAGDVGGGSDLAFPKWFQEIFERFGRFVFRHAIFVVGRARQSGKDSQTLAVTLDHWRGDPAGHQFRPFDFEKNFPLDQRHEVAFGADVNIAGRRLTGSKFGGDLTPHRRHRRPRREADLDVAAEHLVHQLLVQRHAFGAAQRALAPA